MANKNNNNVTEIPELVPHMMKALKTAFSRDNDTRTGLHVSDLVYCLRKAWYRRQQNYRDDIDDNSILYFVRGRSLHDLLEKLYAQREVRVIYNGIKGTIDAITHDNKAVEIKTTKKLWKNTPNDHHLKQLQYYLAMYNTDIGILLYYEVHDNNLRYFEVTQNPLEKELILKELDAKALELRTALDTSDVEKIVHAPEYDWECGFCNIAECPKKKEIKK